MTVDAECEKFAKKTAANAYPARAPANSTRMSQVARTVGAALRAYLAEDDALLKRLDREAGDVLRNLEKKHDRLPLGVHEADGEALRLPTLIKADVVIPVARERRAGEPVAENRAATHGRLILAMNLHDELDGVALADWFLTGRGANIPHLMSPSLCHSLGGFFSVDGVDYLTVDRCVLGKKLKRELDEHRINGTTFEAKLAVAQTLILVMCRAIGIKKDRARGLFDAERKRAERRDNRKAVPPKST